MNFKTYLIFSFAVITGKFTGKVSQIKFTGKGTTLAKIRISCKLEKSKCN
jgi:hypothetical protein